MTMSSGGSMPWAGAYRHHLLGEGRTHTHLPLKDKLMRNDPEPDTVHSADASKIVGESNHYFKQDKFHFLQKQNSEAHTAFNSGLYLGCI